MSEMAISTKICEKMLICWNSLERGRLITEIKRSVIDFGYEILEDVRAGGYSVEFYDHSSETKFIIRTVSSCQWSFWNHLRGKIFDEMIITRNAYKSISDKAEIIDLFKRINKEGYGKDRYLMRILLSRRNLLSEIEEGLPDEVRDCHGSIYRSVNFPVSFYRRGMEEYFQDPNAPTHEEFLMALALEGISASTESEEKAVEEAIVRSKG